MLRTAVARVCFTMTYRLYRGDSPLLYPALQVYGMSTVRAKWSLSPP